MELEIEKLVYGGDGLARSQCEGGRTKTFFVPYVLPGERVEASVVEERPAFARAHLARILSASPLRSEPPCAYFGRCGGCHYQHTSYDEQLKIKSSILEETLRRTGRIELAVPLQVHPSPPLHYRNRTRLHVRGSGEFAVGYFVHGSHELLEVRECPISSPLINRALQGLWDVGTNIASSGIREVELFANQDDTRLLVEFHSDRLNRKLLRELANEAARALPEITGVVAFERSSRTETGPGELLFGENSIAYEVRTDTYTVSAGAFFQTNRHLLPTMLQIVLGDRSGHAALDLYSGVGFFARPLARHFDRVVAVESSALSCADLRNNVPANVKVAVQSTEQYFHTGGRSYKPELIVADPPRAGLGARVCKHISNSRALQFVYVSCDPATLARDLQQLLTSGWKIREMHLLDMFPQTFHIETCAVLSR